MQFSLNKVEYSAILSTFIKLHFVIKIFVLSIFEWPFYTGFTVYFRTYFYLHLKLHLPMLKPAYYLKIIISVKYNSFWFELYCDLVRLYQSQGDCCILI